MWFLQILPTEQPLKWPPCQVIQLRHKRMPIPKFILNCTPNWHNFASPLCRLQLTPSTYTKISLFIFFMYLFLSLGIVHKFYKAFWQNNCWERLGPSLCKVFSQLPAVNFFVFSQLKIWLNLIHGSPNHQLNWYYIWGLTIKIASSS